MVYIPFYLENFLKKINSIKEICKNFSLPIIALLPITIAVNLTIFTFSNELTLIITFIYKSKSKSKI